MNSTALELALMPFFAFLPAQKFTFLLSAAANRAGGRKLVWVSSFVMVFVPAPFQSFTCLSLQMLGTMCGAGKLTAAPSSSPLSPCPVDFAFTITWFSQSQSDLGAHYFVLHLIRVYVPLTFTRYTLSSTFVSVAPDSPWCSRLSLDASFLSCLPQLLMTLRLNTLFAAAVAHHPRRARAGVGGVLHLVLLPVPLHFQPAGGGGSGQAPGAHVGDRHYEDHTPPPGELLGSCCTRLIVWGLFDLSGVCLTCLGFV